MKILTKRSLSGYINIRFNDIRYKLTSEQGEFSVIKRHVI